MPFGKVTWENVAEALNVGQISIIVAKLGHHFLKAADVVEVTFGQKGESFDFESQKVEGFTGFHKVQHIFIEFASIIVPLDCHLFVMNNEITPNGSATNDSPPIVTNLSSNQFDLIKNFERCLLQFFLNY